MRIDVLGHSSFTKSETLFEPRNSIIQAPSECYFVPIFDLEFIKTNFRLKICASNQCYPWRLSGPRSKAFQGPEVCASMELYYDIWSSMGYNAILDWKAL